MCPNEFGREDMEKGLLSKGHIMPEATGGKIYTLECKDCNVLFGRQFDSHAANEVTLISFLDMKPGQKIPVRINPEGKDGIKANFQWTSEPGIIVEEPIGKKHVKSYQNCLRTMTTGSREIRDWKLDIETDVTIDLDRRDISLIHSAHLMMFYCFGYNYLLAKSTKPILDMFDSIKKGDDPLVKPKYIIANIARKIPASIQLPAVGILRRPRNLKSFVVVLPTGDPFRRETIRAVFIPGMGEKGRRTFNNLIELKRSGKRISNSTASLIIDGPKSLLTAHPNRFYDLWNERFRNMK